MKALILLLVTAVTALAGHAFGGVGVHIERVDLARPGDQVTVTIGVVNPSGDFQMGGFDMTVRFDTTLVLNQILPGQLLNLCQWEYFNYTPIGTHDLQIIAIADVSNGSHHPTCYGAPTAEIVDLVFTIPPQPSLYNTFFPLRFIWYECGDNGISSRAGDSLFMSNRVLDFDGFNEIEITESLPFPTVAGAPSSCETTDSARILDFYNGGVSTMQQDLVPPVAQCPGDMVVGTDSGLCGTVVEFTATVSDNKPGATISCTPPSGTIFPTGANLVTCVAQDASGNVDTCLFMITVVDWDPPQISRPNDTVIATDPGSCNAIFSYSASATDVCGGVTFTTFPPSGSTFEAGTTAVALRAVDLGGNVTVDTFLVTVEDREPPVTTHPSLIVVGNDPGVCGAEVFYEVSASDNCTLAELIVEPPSGTLFPIAQIPVRVMAVDSSGNVDTSLFWVRVQDTEDPILLCPDTIAVPLPTDGCEAAVEFNLTATDNCGAPVIATSVPSGSAFPSGVTEVTAVATDRFGRTDSCRFVVVVEDVTPPVLVSAGDTVIVAEEGACGATVVYPLAATDNCGDVQLVAVPEPGAFLPLGVTQVEAIALDGAGNADTCRFTVTIIDTLAPVLSCPGNTVVAADSGAYTAIVEFAVVAGDNCGASVVCLPESGTAFPVGSSWVAAIATDPSGNADTCTFSVTVVLDDVDGDLVARWEDNCPEHFNPDQADADGDGIGDACCCVLRGDADNSGSTGTAINVGDLTYIVNYLMRGGPTPACPEQADANASGEVGGGINIGDVTFLVRYLFYDGTPPPPCP